MKELILLKLGGSVITNKDRPFTENRKALKRLAREIKNGYGKEKKLVIVHGGGSFGHYIVNETGIDKGIKTNRDLLAFAETQNWQNRLNSIVCEYLQKQGLPAMPCQASGFSVMKSKRLFWMPVNTIMEMLKVDLIPVLYGVPAIDTDQGCSILSGDQIISWLAKEILPNRIIIGIDIDGIYTEDPKKYKNSKLIKEIRLKDWGKVKKHLSGSSSVDVTGGMLGKVQELLEPVKLGITCELLNANKPKYIERALRGEKALGTVLRP